jgi:phosphate transport system substrate-binding protein
MKRVSAFLLMGIILCGGVGWGQTGATAIRIDGSPSMAELSRRLTEWYHNDHPDASFTVSSDGPSKGIAALIDGRAEVVQSSRQALAGEIGALRERRGEQFVQIPVATEVAGILVHPANPVHELSIFDLRQILSRTVKNWKQVGGYDAPIRIYGRDASSDIREFIQEEFMGDESISSSAETFPKNTGLYDAVAKDKNGIGYGTVNMGLNPNVRFVAIRASSSGAAVSPTTENVLEHLYPLTRPLYYIFTGRPSGNVQQFGQWVLSGHGQLVVEAIEYWPLGPLDREHGKNLLAANGAKEASRKP